MMAQARICLALAALFMVLPLAAQGQETRTANNGNVILDGIPEFPADLPAKLRQYENVRSASFADWSEDGGSIYVTTRFGAVSQLHRVDMPGGARRQLTFFAEPVFGATRRPESAELLFRMDEGGAEFYQLFLLDPRSAEYRRLSDGRSRNSSPEWSGDGQRLAYTSTRRNGRSNDIYVMAVGDTSSARLVLETSDGAFWGAADWHPKAERLLVVQYISITDSRLHVLDLASGERRLVAGGAGGGDDPSSYTGVNPVFTADGDGIFLATDARGDFRQLGKLELASGELRILTGEIPWDIQSFELSEDGGRAAFVTNEGGISRLYLMDPSSERYEPVEAVPVGVISGLTFNADGRKLAFTLNSAQTPSDVYTLALGSRPTDAGELTRWTYSEVGGLDTQSFVTPELVSYSTFDEVGGAARQIPAFVYKPRGAGPHPVIISIHGGPEGQYRPRFSSTYQMWVSELGTAVIAPNVRGSAGYGKEYVKLDNGYLRENSVKDIGALLDWIATQPDLDETRVAVYGGSYGGYMVLATMVHYSDRLRAGVEIVGISNFVTFLENTQDYRRDLRRPEYGDERDPEMRKFLQSISPNRHAAKITAPLFVAQGENDPRVPVTESDQIVRDIRANDRDIWYMKALNEGHGFRKKENRDLYSQLVVYFFQTHLLPERAVSLMGSDGG